MNDSIKINPLTGESFKAPEYEGFKAVDIPHETTFDGNTVDVFEDNDERLKILVHPANTGGCAYYRCWLPFKKLEEHCSDKVKIIYDLNPLRFDKEKSVFGEPSTNFEKCYIFFTHNICNFGGVYTLRAIHEARRRGKFVHYDTDDLLTELYSGHRLQELYKEKRLDDITKECYKMAHMTSVTQRKFAERIAEFCGGMLCVIKNAVDFSLPCWNLPKRPVPRKNLVRIGWVGGIHHEEDVKEFHSVALRVNAKVGVENVHWGFYGKPHGVQEKDEWQTKVWDNYEKILSMGVKNYSIYPASPSWDYGGMYSNIDISIAPLQMNAFNDSKSEIKAIEAGIYKIPLVASNVGCYDEVIKNGESGYLIDSNKGATGFINPLVGLIKSKKQLKRMGQNLHDRVSDLYNINNHISGRLDLYNSVLSQFKEIVGAQKS